MGDRPTIPRAPHRRYFVVVTKGERHWWDFALDRGKTHCMLLIWDEFLWIAVNPTVGITEMTYVPMAEGFRHPAEWLDDEHADVLEAELEWDEGMRVPWVWAPVTCVEIVKACLGIRRFWLWTPRQLGRYLRRRHGRAGG